MTASDPGRPAITPDPVGRSHPATRPTRTRSVAWVYYTILAGVALVASFAVGPAALVPAILLGAYAAYIYRGGRFVIWIW